mgnify:FL=1
MLKRIKSWLLPLLLVPVGCAQPPAVTSEPAQEFASQGLYLVTGSGFASAYARPDAKLNSYRTVNIEKLQLNNIDIPNTVVGGTLRRNWQMTDERVDALQSVWDGAMRRSFSAYTLVGSDDTALRITAAITRLAPGRPTATTIGGGAQPMSSSQDVIEVSAEFRLYDQPTGELLAVIRDSRTMLSVGMSRTAPAAIQTMFNSWAALLHTRVAGR